MIKNIEGLSLLKVPDYADNNHWLNLLQINKKIYNEDNEVLMKRLEENGIQTRPVWKLNHEQKPYKNCQNYNVDNANELVKNSLCIPSSSNLSNNDLNKIISFLLPFGSTDLKSAGKETLPFLSILLKNCDTNKSIKNLNLYNIGLSWDYMGVNGIKYKFYICSINVHV